MNITRNNSVDVINKLLDNRNIDLNSMRSPYEDVEIYKKAFSAHIENKSDFTNYIKEQIKDSNELFIEILFDNLNLAHSIMKDLKEKNKSVEEQNKTMEDIYLEPLFNRSTSKGGISIEIFKTITDVMFSLNYPYGLGSLLDEDVDSRREIHLDSDNSAIAFHHLLTKERKTLIELFSNKNLVENQFGALNVLYFMNDKNNLQILKNELGQLNLIKNKNTIASLKDNNQDVETLAVYCSLLKESDDYMERGSDLFFWKGHILDKLLLIPSEKEYIKSVLFENGFNGLPNYFANKEFLFELANDINKVQEGFDRYNFLKKILTNTTRNLDEDTISKIIDMNKDEINKNYNEYKNDEYAMWNNIRELCYENIELFNLLSTKFNFLNKEPLVIGKMIDNIIEKSNKEYINGMIISNENNLKKLNSGYLKELKKVIKNNNYDPLYKSRIDENFYTRMFSKISDTNLKNTLPLITNILEISQKNIFDNNEENPDVVEYLYSKFEDILEMDSKIHLDFGHKKDPKGEFKKSAIYSFMINQFEKMGDDNIFKAGLLINEDEEEINVKRMNLIVLMYDIINSVKNVPDSSIIDSISMEYKQDFMLSFFDEKLKKIYLGEDESVKFYDEKISSIIESVNPEELNIYWEKLKKYKNTHSSIRDNKEMVEEEKNKHLTMMENIILRDNTFKEVKSVNKKRL